MTNKHLKYTAAVLAIICILCCSATAALAAPSMGEGDLSGGKRIIIGLPETEADETEVPSEPVTETDPVTTPETTQSKTSETVVETTKKTTVPTKRPSTASGNRNTTEKRQNVERNDEPVANQTPAESQTTTLPEGSFYVYLELNNGQPRLKRVLDEPGLVPEPTEPVRNGYVFDGWYADAKLTVPWDFFTSVADEKTVIYAKWVADGSTAAYRINVSQTVGGTIEANPTVASEGEPVVITVLPEDGKRIVAGSLMIDGKPSDIFSFVMPAHDVVISAEFENIPENALNEKEDESVLPFIIGGAVLVIAAVSVTVILLLRKKALSGSVEIDENGTLVIDDDDDAWVDESIVIEDGFTNGKKVQKNIEPDYGEVEEDNDY